MKDSYESHYPQAFSLPCKDVGAITQERLSAVKEPLSLFIIKGVVEPGTTTEFTINGIGFNLRKNTWTLGDFKPGVLAKVEGAITECGERFARKIVVQSCS